MPTAKKTKKEQMPPEEYFRILRGLTLNNIRLVNCSAKAKPEALSEPQSQPVAMRVSIDDEAEFETADGSLTIIHKYQITTKSKNKNIFSLSAEYELDFDAEEEITEEFLEIFKELSLRLSTWPYLRELASSMTGRMDLPKLQLGLWRVPFG